MQFRSFEDGIEVNGATITSVISSLQGVNLLKSLFIDAGLPDPQNIIGDSAHWYSQQKWLNVFREIAQRVGTRTLFNIGRNIPERAVFPDFQGKSMINVLKTIDVAYHINHRNQKGELLFDPSRPAKNQWYEGIGHYGVDEIPGYNLAVMKCQTPYPCEFDRGIIFAMSQKFTPTAVVYHDDSKPCRKDGAAYCTYLISWGDF